MKPCSGHLGIEASDVVGMLPAGLVWQAHTAATLSCTPWQWPQAMRLIPPAPVERLRVEAGRRTVDLRRALG